MTSALQSSRSALLIRPYEAGDETAVIRLWHDAGLTRPWNDPQRDIARKCGTQPELFLVATAGGAPIGTAMAGYDGHRGWVHYLAVAATHRRQAVGTALMRAAEQLLADRGCPKLNLMVRSSNAEVIGFYAALGYAQDDVVTLARRLIRDAPVDAGGA